ncbi:CCT domain [Plasmopara halstedii]|uniref:CCT domain n=1 Tax=Plasmopara halstedii TaxID=4781 RepID=A0A0P1AKA5_PLAHL|nr:CCT domain [Plasmopara halstedii]CEG41818.1 CCT domain [Plasmopara halstedii]|eukprot:XP_024578187.1 CCT domain [Plasmopara halstedii]
MSTRVFVRLYDGTTQHETDDEVLELPPPPLKWKDAITTMVAALGKQNDYEDGVTTPKARLFLLPTEIMGIAAELNARSLRFGVRENDHFVICLRGEDYQQPSERQIDLSSVITPIASSESGRPTSLTSPNSCVVTSQVNIASQVNGLNLGANSSTGAVEGPPIGVLGSNARSGSLTSGAKKGNKRYRSISGKMAAIKSLSDKGLISNDDRGHLKDLLLNNDSPQLQEALEKYNNTGDFEAVKNLLAKESHTPSTKRNTGDWLSESFVNEIALNLNATSPVEKSEPISLPNDSNVGHFNTATAPLSQSAMGYGYQSSQTPPMNTSNNSQSTSMTMNYYVNSANLAAPTGNSLSFSRGHVSGMNVSNGYQSFPVMAPYQQPHASPTNMYAGLPPQINLPLRDRATYMKRGYDSSPVHNTIGTSPPAVPLTTSAHLAMNGFGMQQNYTMNPLSYPANVIYARNQSQYPLNTYTSGPLNNSIYNSYQPQPQYATNRYGYGSMQPDMGYNPYAARYGFGSAQLRAGPGGKWTTAPPMPSYPPPCSKEEKKEKIAKWLKKRENRNWSNKPSYPVRHSIAKNRKRGEDGRFITKARLAEMAAEEAAAAAELRDEPQKASNPSSSSEDSSVFLMAQTSIPKATSVP